MLQFVRCRFLRACCQFAASPFPSHPWIRSAQVFDLGSDGSAAPAKVAESSEFLHDAARALGGRDVFGRGGEAPEHGRK